MNYQRHLPLASPIGPRAAAGQEARLLGGALRSARYRRRGARKLLQTLVRTLGKAAKSGECCGAVLLSFSASMSSNRLISFEQRQSKKLKCFARSETAFAEPHARVHGRPDALLGGRQQPRTETSKAAPAARENRTAWLPHLVLRHAQRLLRLVARWSLVKKQRRAPKAAAPCSI